MFISKTAREQITKKFQIHKKDFASAGVQVGLLHESIENLRLLMIKNPKNKRLRLSMIKEVHKKRKLLDFLSNTNNEQYSKVIKKLQLY